MSDTPNEIEAAGYRRWAIEAHVTRADGTEDVREVHSIRFPEPTGPTATAIAVGYWPSVVRAAVAYERAAVRAAAVSVLAASVGLTVEQLNRIVRMLDDQPAPHVRRAWRVYGQRRGHR